MKICRKQLVLGMLVSSLSVRAVASGHDEVSFSLVRMVQERFFDAGCYQPIIEGRFKLQITLNGQTIGQYRFSPGNVLGITSVGAVVADQRGQAFTLGSDKEFLKDGQCIMYLKPKDSVVTHWALMPRHYCQH